jgi:[glutamine synthetase] adenylyltransferase / [glutamine synthetase]-adenylyl-L-tyrosine phosphorylase
VALAFERLATETPEQLESMVDHGEPNGRARAFTAVAAASDSLGRLCITEPLALQVLGDLDRGLVVDPIFKWSDEHSLALAHRLEVLRIAARDLLGLDSLEQVTSALSDSAAFVLAASLELAHGRSESSNGEGPSGEISNGEISVIGMGKLGGNELNYSSDVDILFVTAPSASDNLARRVVAAARHSFRVDTDLRPEGRSGPLTRTLDGYNAYWERWAQTWEFQALIKARPVAGDSGLGASFTDSARIQVWDRTYSADELALIRRLKERSEQIIASRGLTERELKRGPGGIRDVEFAVQLLQLVHGRNDPSIRSRSTLEALDQLAASGYVDAEQSAALSEAYRFLRTVEHRLQLVEEQQTHTVPVDPGAKERLARVLGIDDAPGASATARFDEALRICRTEVRSLHERLFFRPLLEAFAVLPAGGTDVPRSPADFARVRPAGMSPEQISERLEAFGFADVKRTRAVVNELAQGLTRSSRLMGQMLPLLLDWLSVTPDPDLGLLGLRNLALPPHRRSLLVTTFRESPEAARRLCLLMGSSRTLGEAVARNPELMSRLGDNDALAPSGRAELVAELLDRMRLGRSKKSRRERLVRFRQEQLVRVAARDLLDMDSVNATGSALSSVAEAMLEAAIDQIEPDVAFCIIGLGRFGGGELSYASDLDVLFVHGERPAMDAGDATRSPGGTLDTKAMHPSATATPGELAAERLLRLLHGPSPADRIFALDLGLRPEGGNGRLSRDIDGYSLYFERWAQTWERQALLRARVVAGDQELGARFMDAARQFVWEPPFGEEQYTEIRRMKARIEKERIPAGEDPEFHLKLGKGSLSDVEWTVQMLQLRHRVEGAGTMETLTTLEKNRAISETDARALRESYRFCERTRNRWHLVGALPGGASPGDSLPTQPHQLSKLARSLLTTPAGLREDYKRVTRRARRVMERLFYGIEPSAG